MPTATAQTLVLQPCNGTSEGCEPSYDPWTPPKGASVAIYNATDYQQSLTNISGGLLNPSPGNTITLDSGQTWCGTVGNNSGGYDYNDCSTRGKNVAPRRGTIDPS